MLDWLKSLIFKETTIETIDESWHHPIRMSNDKIQIGCYNGTLEDLLQNKAFYLKKYMTELTEADIKYLEMLIAQHLERIERQK